MCMTVRSLACNKTTIANLLHSRRKPCLVNNSRYSYSHRTNCDSDHCSKFIVRVNIKLELLHCKAALAVMLAMDVLASLPSTLPTWPPINGMGIATCPTTIPIEDPPKLPTLVSSFLKFFSAFSSFLHVFVGA